MPRIGVNVSAASLQRADLVDRVAEVLAEAGLEPHQLELELTEHTVMARPAEAIRTLRALRRMGVRLAIDDFGTGYSSLSYLQHFAVDTLKVDKSFVSSLVDDPTARPVETAILKAILALAGHLRMAVVAEGVESPVQRDLLAYLGCHVAQGFLYCRPVRPGQLGDLLHALQSHRARVVTASPSPSPKPSAEVV